MTGADDTLQHVIDTELGLLSPDVRRARSDVERLLHPDFVEFAASGRRWSREETLAAIGGELTDDTAITAHDITATRLTATVVLVTYVSDHGGDRARRSSLWCDTADGWRIRFHQGTLVPDGNEEARR